MDTSPTSNRRQTALRIGASFIVLALIELSWMHALSPLENRMADRFVREHAQNLKPDGDIVIVDIDDASLARMQDTAGSWPWPRSVHGELIRGIARQNPKAIVFDILFSERDEFRPGSDLEFNRSLQGMDNVYFPMVRRDPGMDEKGAPIAQVASLLGLQRTAHADETAHIAILPPLAVDPAHWHTGTINFEQDADGVGRRYQLYTEAHGWLVPSLPTPRYS